MRSTELNYIFVLLCDIESTSDCRLGLVVINCCVETSPISHIQETDCELAGQVFDFRVRCLSARLWPDSRQTSKTHNSVDLNWVCLQPTVLCYSLQNRYCSLNTVGYLTVEAVNYLNRSLSCPIVNSASLIAGDRSCGCSTVRLWERKIWIDVDWLAAAILLSLCLRHCKRTVWTECQPIRRSQIKEIDTWRISRNKINSDVGHK